MNPETALRRAERQAQGPTGEVIVASDSTTAKPPKDARWWYDALATWLLLNPDKTLTEAAQYFGRSASWISAIVHSDSFRVLFRTRAGEINALAAKTTVEQVDGIASLSLEILRQQLENKGIAMEHAEVRETASMVLKSLGYGQSRAAPGVQANVQVNIGVDRETLNSARDKMRELRVVSSDGRRLDGEGEDGANGGEPAAAPALPAPEKL